MCFLNVVLYREDIMPILFKSRFVGCYRCHAFSSSCDVALASPIPEGFLAILDQLGNIHWYTFPVVVNMPLNSRLLQTRLCQQLY